MPLTYSVDATRRLVRATGSEVLTAADIIDLRNRLAADPAAEPGFNALFDFSDVTEFAISADDVRGLASARRMLPRLAPGSRTAVVTDKDVGFGVFRMYQSLTGATPDEFRVFRVVTDAEGWLEGG